jgi:hypothetical protein
VRVEEGPGNPVIRAGHLKDAFSRIFTPRVEIDDGELAHEPMAREELAVATVAVERPFHTATLDFTGVRVAVEDPPLYARVTGTATGTGAEGSERRRLEKREFTMRFEKVDGTWRIAAVSTLPAP